MERGGGGDCGAQAGSTAQLNDRKLRVRCEGEHASSVDAQPQVRHSRTLTDSCIEQSSSQVVFSDREVTNGCDCNRL